METLSEKTFASLCEVIPGGVNSPVRACGTLRKTPLIAERGAGDLIFDPEGNSYIDYCCSWGPLLHGHAHPEILEAVEARMRKGSSFGATTEIEERLARKIVEAVPSIEKLRFVSSGTEATMSAVRLARGFTGRSLVLKFNGNYHGHADLFLVQAGSGTATLSPSSSSAGIPEAAVQNSASLPYNDLEAARHFIRAHAEELACVILEPVAGNMGVVPASPDFLQMLRQETQQCGALLIFDEVISGFRLCMGGAQLQYGILPDLTCLGKVIGGGFPAAAFGGSAEIMDHLAPLGTVYQAGTLSGNPVAMEAGLQTLLLAERTGFYEKLEEKANRITRPVREALERTPHSLRQAGSLFTLFFGVKNVSCFEEAKKADLDAFGSFFRFMWENGVYIPPSQFEAWFVSAAHTEEHLDRTCRLILQWVKQTSE